MLMMATFNFLEILSKNSEIFDNESCDLDSLKVWILQSYYRQFIFIYRHLLSWQAVDFLESMFLLEWLHSYNHFKFPTFLKYNLTCSFAAQEIIWQVLHAGLHSLMASTKILRFSKDDPPLLMLFFASSFRINALDLDSSTPSNSSTFDLIWFCVMIPHSSGVIFKPVLQTSQM